jgi:hypothetical protein
MKKVCFGHNIGTCEMYVELKRHEGYKQVSEIKYNEAQKLYHCIIEKRIDRVPFIINTKVIKRTIQKLKQGIQVINFVKKLLCFCLI